MVQLHLFESSHHIRCRLCRNEFYSKYATTRYCKVCRAILDRSYYRVAKLKMLMKNKKPVLHPRWLNDKDRITIDVDDPKNLDQSLKTIKAYGFTEGIEVRISPGGAGRHIIAHTKQGSYPDYQLLFIRHLALDDPFRIILDAQKGRTKQVLFTKKREVPMPNHIRKMYLTDRKRDDKK